MDYIGPLPPDTKQQYQFILVAVDYTSNLIMAEPYPHQSSVDVYTMILRIISLYGVPVELATDNGKPFISEVVSVLANKLQIKLIQTSAYNPRGNSKAERSIKMIKAVLKHMGERQLNHWSTFVYTAINIINSTKLIYGYAPCEIAYNKPPILRQKMYETLLVKHLSHTDATVQFLEKEAAHLELHRKRELPRIRAFVSDNRQKVREALKRVRNEKDSHVVYTKGEYVYRWRPKVNKHEPTWDGPYIIKDVLGKNTYRLQDLNGNERKALYNGTKLKTAYSYYGSPIRTAAEYTRVYNDQERKYYIHTLKDLISKP